jgi:predicted nucleic-acid-binding protein
LKVTPDTNVLIRYVVKDDADQSERAYAALTSAEMIALSNVCLAEMVWVLRSRYKVLRVDVAATLEQLLATSSMEMNRAAVEFGLAVLEAGGDFADGVIAYEGHRLGGETFVSFDRKAVAAMRKLGREAELLGRPLV